MKNHSGFMPINSNMFGSLKTAVINDNSGKEKR